jgi:hypothetical protein
VQRIGACYLRLMACAAQAGVPVLRILWNNVRVLRSHRADAVLPRARPACRPDGAQHQRGEARWSRQRAQPPDCASSTICDRIFVHTQRMRDELQTDFSIPAERIAVIPFSINNTPTTAVTGRNQTTTRLAAGDQVMLFFSQIAPTGLEYLIEHYLAFAAIRPCGW